MFYFLIIVIVSHCIAFSVSAFLPLWQCAPILVIIPVSDVANKTGVGHVLPCENLFFRQVNRT